eukprot:403367591
MANTPPLMFGNNQNAGSLNNSFEEVPVSPVFAMNNNQPGSPAMIQHNIQKMCAACTYMNSANANSCMMCGSGLGDQNEPVSPLSQNED